MRLHTYGTGQCLGRACSFTWRSETRESGGMLVPHPRDLADNGAIAVGYSGVQRRAPVS